MKIINTYDIFKNQEAELARKKEELKEAKQREEEAKQREEEAKQREEEERKLKEKAYKREKAIKIQFAKHLLQTGRPISEIVKLTGLDNDELERLK